MLKSPEEIISLEKVAEFYVTFPLKKRGASLMFQEVRGLWKDLVAFYMYFLECEWAQELMFERHLRLNSESVQEVKRTRESNKGSSI